MTSENAEKWSWRSQRPVPVGRDMRTGTRRVRDFGMGPPGRDACGTEPVGPLSS